MRLHNLAPTRVLAGIAAIGGVAALLVGAGQAGAPTEPATLRIVATDYHYDLPASVPAGVTRLTLVNRGNEMHHAQLVRLEEGKTLADFATLPPDGPPPAWAVLVGGPNAVEPGDSSEVIASLTPGNYALLCFIPSGDHRPHMMKGMAASFTVTRSLGGLAPMPKADLTMRLADYAFGNPASIPSGTRHIAVVNDATQPHEVVLFQLAPGKTTTDLAAFAAAIDGQGTFEGPPPGHLRGGIVGLAPGGTGMMEVNLEPGSYALICFLPDARDGQPHFMHGMIAPVTVAPAGR